jgi:hypothetical protein
VGQNLDIEAIDQYQDTPLVFAETADLVRSNMELLIVVGTEIRTLVANCRFRGAQDMARAA